MKKVKHLFNERRSRGQRSIVAETFPGMIARFRFNILNESKTHFLKKTCKVPNQRGALKRSHRESTEYLAYDKENL
jgi:hypothetical protein